MGLSQWVLEKLLPPGEKRFQLLLKNLKFGKNESFILAEIHDLLAKSSSAEFEQMVAQPPGVRLSEYWENYIAAMVEYTAHQKGVPCPAWTKEIPPLGTPVFGSRLGGLRLHLLTHSPPPFRNTSIC